MDRAQIRLNKYLASAGMASRRASEALIRERRVAVNGQVAETPGIRIDPVQDRVTVDGQPVERVVDRVYVMLNKPSGYLTSASDPFGRPTVMDLLNGLPHRVFPVGRLDFGTEGLLLLTNDGELGHALTHPRYEIRKTYQALVAGRPTPGALRRLEQGVLVEGRLTAPAQVDLIEELKHATRLSIVIHEGRKRQIRHMCACIGYPVLHLRRIRLGPLELGDLGVGQWRYLTADEVERIRALIEACKVRG